MITNEQQLLKRGNRGRNKQNVISINQNTHAHISNEATKWTITNFINQTVNVNSKQKWRQR